MDTTQDTVKTSYHHGNLRQGLIDTALLHIAKHGAEKLSLRAVARDIGVSQSAIYRHFSDKSALLTAIVSQGFETLRQSMTQCFEQHHHSPKQALVAVGAAYISFAFENPETYRLMFGMRVQELQTEELNSCAADGHEIIVKIICGGISKGNFQELNPQSLALSAWSLVHGLSSLTIDGQISHSPIIVDGQLNWPLVNQVLNTLMTGFDKK